MTTQTTEPEELEVILNNVFSKLEIGEASLLFPDVEQHRKALKTALLQWRTKSLEAVLRELLNSKLWVDLTDDKKVRPTKWRMEAVPTEVILKVFKELESK